MDIVSALRAEESRLRQHLNATRQQLDTVKAAMKLLQSMNGNQSRGRKSVITAAARAKMSRAAKRRWARIKAAKKG
jgi:hypothetical protein